MKKSKIILITTILLITATIATAYTYESSFGSDRDENTYSDIVKWDYDATNIFSHVHQGQDITVEDPSPFYGSKIVEEDDGQRITEQPDNTRDAAADTTYFNVTYVANSYGEDNWAEGDLTYQEIDVSDKLEDGWTILNRRSTHNPDESIPELVTSPNPDAGQLSEHACGDSVKNQDGPDVSGIHECPEDYGLPANRYDDETESNVDTAENTITERSEEIEARPDSGSDELSEPIRNRDGDNDFMSWYDPSTDPGHVGSSDASNEITGSTSDDPSSTSSGASSTDDDPGSDSYTYDFSTYSDWFFGPFMYQPNHKEIWMTYPRTLGSSHDIPILEQESEYRLASSIDEYEEAGDIDTCDGSECTSSATSNKCWDYTDESHTHYGIKERTDTVVISDSSDEENRNYGEVSGNALTRIIPESGEFEDLTRYGVTADGDGYFEVEETSEDASLEIEVTYQEVVDGERDFDTDCTDFGTRQEATGCENGSLGDDDSGCGTSSGPSYYETTDTTYHYDDYDSSTKSIYYQDTELVEEPVFTLNPNTNPEGSNPDDSADDYIHDPEETYRSPQDREGHISIREALFAGENLHGEEYEGESDSFSEDGGTLPYNYDGDQTWISYNIDYPDTAMENSFSVSRSNFSIDTDDDTLDFISVREDFDTFNADGPYSLSNGYVTVRHDTSGEDRTGWQITGTTVDLAQNETTTDGASADFIEVHQSEESDEQTSIERLLSERGFECPTEGSDEYTHCTAYVGLYLEELDNWDDPNDPSTGVSMDIHQVDGEQSVHTSESLGACRMYESIADEDFDLDDDENVQCTEEFSDGGSGGNGDNGEDPVPGCGGVAGEWSHYMEGPAVNTSYLEEPEDYNEDIEGSVREDIQGHYEGCVEQNQCVLHGAAVDEGTVANVAHDSEIYEGYEYGGDTVDWEVCLNIDEIDDEMGYHDEGGQWYDLDDPIISEYLQQGESGNFLTSDAGDGSDLISDASQDDREDPEHIAFYYRRNPNPYHSEWNPTGYHLDGDEEEYYYGTALESTCRVDTEIIDQGWLEYDESDIECQDIQPEDYSEQGYDYGDGYGDYSLFYNFYWQTSGQEPGGNYRPAEAP